MAYISEKKALKALRSNLDRGRAILARGGELDGVDGWRHDSSRLLVEIFGDSDDYVVQFKAIDMASYTVVDEPAVLRSERDLKVRVGGLEDSIEVIEDSINHLAEYGLPSERTQTNLWMSRGFMAIAVTVIGSLLVLFIWKWWTGDDDVKGSREATQDSTAVPSDVDSASAELTRNDFEYWLWSFDETLGKELDSMKMDWRQRGVFNSGMAVTETIRFYEAKRMERDHVIDSFLISYSGQRGDTTQLSYSRKLPGNVGVGLTRWANSMDLDIHHHHVDTL